jgi:hypothetical protein
VLYKLYNTEANLVIFGILEQGLIIKRISVSQNTLQSNANIKKASPQLSIKKSQRKIFILVGKTI